jgi:hypothetical protein
MTAIIAYGLGASEEYAKEIGNATYATDEKHGAPGAYWRFAKDIFSGKGWKTAKNNFDTDLGYHFPSRGKGPEIEAVFENSNGDLTAFGNLLHYEQDARNQAHAKSTFFHLPGQDATRNNRGAVDKTIQKTRDELTKFLDNNGKANEGTRDPSRINYYLERLTAAGESRRKIKKILKEFDEEFNTTLSDKKF